MYTKQIFSSRKTTDLINLKNPNLTDFNFKYTSELHLAKVVKHVRRKRQQKQDEDEWKLFYKKKIEEEMEEEKQPFRNNADLDLEKHLLPELFDTVGKDKTGHNSSNVTDSNFKTINENNKNECKCNQSEVESNVKYLIHKDNNTLSEESDVCVMKELNVSNQLSQSSQHYMDKQDEAFEENVVYQASECNTNGTNRKCQVSGPLCMGVLKKMADLVTYINKIETILSTSQNENVDSDVAERNLKRNNEFTTLFARNYLYRIQRQKKEAKKMFVDSFPLPQEKLMAMYQTALNALQVYERHLLKSCIHKKCIKQLEQIFDFILYLTSLMEKVTGKITFPHRNELVNGSKQLKIMLSELVEAESCMSSVVVKKPTNKMKTKQKSSDKLSMYVSKQPKPFWKKTSAKLARVKFGPPSVKKSREQNKGKEIIAPKTKLKKSSGPEQSKVTLEEQDNVQEYEPQNQSCENEISITKSFRHATRAIPEEEVVSMMEILSPQIHPNLEVSSQQSFNEQLRDGTEFSAGQEYTTSRKMSSNIIWPRNIQMVCLKAEEVENKNLCSSKLTEVNVSKPKDAIKHQLTVSDSDRESALRYKAECTEFAENYEEGNKPWEIVCRISDQVTTDILESICKTLEIDIVIKKLYDLEFR